MAPATTTRQALFAGLIDHAPTFPPEELPLDEGLAEHRRVKKGDDGWIVNRFVCPASKLAALGDEPLRLSVVIDTGSSRRPTSGSRRSRRRGSIPRCSSTPPPRSISSCRCGDDVSFRILQIGELGLRAKVRCGGSVLPSVPALAEFVQACRRLEVPFKATAGLHHAVRSGDDHGFLNLLAAAVFGDEEEALAEEDPSAFAVTDEAFGWREHQAGPDEIASIRRDLFVSFGSCSAQEPIDGLRALGMLPG